MAAHDEGIFLKKKGDMMPNRAGRRVPLPEGDSHFTESSEFRFCVERVPFLNTSLAAAPAEGRRSRSISEGVFRVPQAIQ